MVTCAGLAVLQGRGARSQPACADTSWVTGSIPHSVVAKQHVHHKGKCPPRAKAQHYNISRYTALSTTPVHPLFAVFFPQYESSSILQIIVGCQESEIKSKIGTSASISTLSSQLGE